jgi:hypothetical protein
MRVHNYLEEIVERLTDDYPDRTPDFCGCEQCKAVVAAMVLTKCRPLTPQSPSAMRFAQSQSGNLGSRPGQWSRSCRQSRRSPPTPTTEHQNLRSSDFRCFDRV